MIKKIKILSGVMFLKIYEEESFGAIKLLCYEVMDSIFSYQTECEDIIIIDVNITVLFIINEFCDYKFTYLTEVSKPENGDECPSYVREFDPEYLKDRLNTCFVCLAIQHNNVPKIKTVYEVEIKIIKK
jgi:hypothetical protein